MPWQFLVIWRMPFVFAALVFLIGCESEDKPNAMTDLFTVSVNSQVRFDGTPVNGFQIKVDGLPKFVLDFGETKSFPVEKGTRIITASHPNMVTDAQFTLILAGESGPVTLTLSSSRVLGTNVVSFFCNNCDTQTGITSEPRYR